ncbi:hypothetical protein MTR67_043003 [Solanum verrucosum]|uniref:Uncharacterized protein n=1 Tax=Solanum verrucosum TaxID=315347 RepID=A0AAF0UQG9_SOLVR|nr:hypothetical protein MTR67_043003 [Solanum verrucosum]
MMAQANREPISSVNPNIGTTMTKIRDFLRKNPPEFHSFKLDEDLQDFIDKCLALNLKDVVVMDRIYLLAQGVVRNMKEMFGRCSNKNKSYALKTRQDQEDSPDVVTDMLKVFNLDVYALLDLRLPYSLLLVMWP